ncbi:MAG TPA: hypothetical protein VFU21_10410, partial [Kofleriaceae bacterium]|nr:hypothetical protein [Kofleriaceae bacterium]
KQTLSDTTLAPGAVQRHRFALAALGRGLVNLELRYVYALDEHAHLPGTEVARVIWQRRVDPDALPRCSARVGQ